MSLMQMLPWYLVRILEDYGLEEELSHRDSNLYIELPDFDMAYNVRERLQPTQLEFRLIAHPATGNPTIEIFNVIPNH